MAGDHKCPVCQATFTRPQHVARHMRSHTGDRPYKCQYCGDQFARSDLLSRHVNKCHANEKPMPSTGARRKGATGASRATTSKQACDQCVQSSLPCDGCNPCSKCISRKSRCTYVKFHRQTAPVGPGHNTRPNAPPSSVLTGSLPPPSSLSTSASSSSRLPLYHHGDDDFILGPAPSAVPTMAEALYQSNTFAFPALYPHNDVGGLPDGSADYASKYRAQQAELFGPGRSGLGTGLTPLYDPRPGSSSSSSSWMSGWDGQDSHETYQPQSHRTSDYVSASAPSASTLHGNHFYPLSARYM
ncbi:hypothetical protein CPB83DRAFT_858023 [Crepidotus variabilis]|uniref:Uncharacterized protein n=1 Tax=Crepidotus variabilis TaxID=179855 RepID=A0A9P6ECI3_9AGAR|nr:hypothetical protein CPB83DRAFT_858023 [Crepidotus variabilis]